MPMSHAKPARHVHPVHAPMPARSCPYTDDDAHALAHDAHGRDAHAHAHDAHGHDAHAHAQVKAASWLGPAACALLNEATGSLRLAVLSALVFYLPSMLVMLVTDFDAARHEALLPHLSTAEPTTHQQAMGQTGVSHGVQPPRRSPPSSLVDGALAGARMRLLPDADRDGGTDAAPLVSSTQAHPGYGTAG